MGENNTNCMIRLLRIEQNISQHELYKGIFSKSVYLKVENGEKKTYNRWINYYFR